MARFNPAIKQSMRQRRQAEGKLPPQPYYPPNPQPAQFVDSQYYDAYPDSYEGIQDMPLTFAYTRRGELNGDSGEQQGRARQDQWMPPAYDTVELTELPTSHQDLARSLDASHFPDSDLYAEGDKIRPWAHIRVPGYLAIAEWLGGADDEFKYGKGYFRQHVPQYFGGQHPIDVNPLIPEVEYTTYGATNELAPGQLAQFPSADGYLFD